MDTGGGELSGVLGDGGQAEDLVRVGVHDDLDEPAGVAVDQRAGHVVQRQDAAIAADPRSKHFLLGHPDRSDRGPGERHPRQAGIVDGTIGVGERVLGDEGAVVGGDVDELGVPGHVARGPDPRVRGPQPVGDDHLAGVPGLHPDRIEVQAIGDGTASEGDEHLLGAELLRVAGHVGGHDGLASRAAGDPGGHHAADDADAFVGERLLKRLGHLRLLLRGEPGPHQQRDLRAEASEQLRLLQGDVAAAEHQQRLRNLSEFHCRGRGQVPGLLQAVDRRCPRARTSRDQEVVGLDGLDRPVAGDDLQYRGVWAAGERCIAAADLPAVGVGDVGVLLAAQRLDQRLLPGDQRRHVHCLSRRRDPREPA